MIPYCEPPFQDLNSRDWSGNSITLRVVREDLNHPEVSGNKWWKLRDNLKEARRQGLDQIITFGGAFSNHVAATAAAAEIEGMKSIGVIRGEARLPYNKTLRKACEKGMVLHHVSRTEYRRKEEQEFLDSLLTQFGPSYIIPEGGTNRLAVNACQDWAAEMERSESFDYLCVAAGTGGTAAGLINGLSPAKRILVFPVVRPPEQMAGEIRKWITTPKPNWTVIHDYHFGGYAKWNDELIAFIQRIRREYNIPLDRVYTAKLFFGVLDLIRKHYFPAGSRILIVHTGGLQGEP